MIVDTSALIAILRDEPDAAAYVRALAQAETRRISAGSYLEAGIVADRSPISAGRLDPILAELAIEIEPVTAAQARIGREAYRTYGRGSGHPAKLNFGDCFAYALAREKDEPLLYKGTDFGLTDIRFAGRPSDRRRLSELIPAYG